ncbi:MAG: major intrinsic protein [Chitinophagaceae bacterium]|nr:major intrinsic protein [Chitinophagaceae bacterium]
MKTYIVEFIGTFFLVLGATLYGAVGASLSLMVMIYAGGHISGAHYNPAVTLAVMIRGKATLKEAIRYWIAQFAGAIVAVLLALFVFKIEGSGNCIIPEDGIAKAITAEVIGTFALAFVILNVATTKGTQGNSFYGLAIGGTVLAMALTVGQFSGGAFNPAVAVALSIQKTLCWAQIWIYLVACFGGGALAGVVFNYINEDDKPTPPIPDAGE